MKHKRKLLVLVVVLGCLLVACAPSTGSSSPSASTATVQNSSALQSEPVQSQQEAAPDTEYSAQGGAGAVTLLLYGGARNGNEEIVLSPAQQDAIALQVQEVALKYLSGEYPMPVPQGTEAVGFYAHWPLDVEIPHKVAASQLRFVTEEYELYDLGVQLPLGGDWRMECTLYTDAEDYTSPDAVWLPMAVAFVDGNGVWYIT